MARLIFDKDLRSDNVGRHQVRSELDTPEVDTDRGRECLDQFGLSQTGHSLEQDVSFSEQTDESLSNEVVLTEYPLPNRIFDGQGRVGVVVDLG
jgi:hypothetical protein